ncbi:MAG: hypothetical protein F6K23_14600 [Okeania sp. SIO2C9]|nr:hypothetical protein [Okeania sp. SIO2C9]
MSGDGVYDKRKCYSAASHRGAKPTIPPRKNAVIWHHGNCNSPPHPRDENLREIRICGGKKRVLNSPSHGECKKHSRQWKRESGYHRRSRFTNNYV